MTIVVAILAIAAAIAIPQASTVSPAKVDATAGEIASAMRFAQREAQRTQVWHVVKFDTATQSLRVYRLTTAGIVGEDTSKPVLHPVSKINYQVALSSAGASITGAVFKYQNGATTNYASFGPDGSPADIHGWLLKDIDPLQGDGTVTVRHGNVQRVVKVAAVTGRVTF
jgi:Tfp pilus assembly protein FimT